MSDRASHRAPTSPGRALASAPWVVVVLGVGVMVMLLILAVAASCGPSSDEPPAPVVPALPLSTVPGAAVDPSTPAASTGTPTSVPNSPNTRTTTPSPTRTPSLAARRPSPTSGAPGRTPEPAPEMTGRYRVVASFDDSFIGEVLVVNDGATEQDWVVRLAFPAEVRDLRTSWVESSPRPAVNRAGDAYLFAGTVRLAPGQRAALRFHFDRVGPTNDPISCQVNGGSCR